MRITSDLFVSALMRRAFAAGGFAAIERRGAAEAGAIFVVARSRMGELTLFGPAPQTSYEEGRPDRLFAELVRSDDPGEVTARLDKEARFDPDLWIVEVELEGPLLSELVPIRKP